MFGYIILGILISDETLLLVFYYNNITSQCLDIDKTLFLVLNLLLLGVWRLDEIFLLLFDILLLGFLDSSFSCLIYTCRCLDMR